MDFSVFIYLTVVLGGIVLVVATVCAWFGTSARPAKGKQENPQWIADHGPPGQAQVSGSYRSGMT